MNRNIKNEMKLEFLSKSANEAFARIAVAAFASQLDPTIEEIADIKTAVSEAVTNSIIHAYENRQGIIRINAKLKDNNILGRRYFYAPEQRGNGLKFVLENVKKKIGTRPSTYLFLTLV